ncbi:MAG: hypothetical protein NZM17_05050 [Pyrinomonadaceae bacterium]|nr:hypothetical protein [Pyrinomonadaceae bacterium]
MKLEKLILSVFISAIFLSACNSTNTPQTQQTSVNKKDETKLPEGFGNANVEQTKIPEEGQQQPEQKSLIELKEEEKRKFALKAQQNPVPIDISKQAKTRLSDGSEYWAILDEKGVTETREFKNHPQLAKIEKFTQGKNSTVKAYLKDGRVLQIPANKIRDFAQDTAEQILMAAGIKTVTKPVENQTKERKEESKQ